MRTRLIGSIGACLTAAGLAFGDGQKLDEPAPDKPAASESAEQQSKDPKKPQPVPEQIQTAPTPAADNASCTPALESPADLARSNLPDLHDYHLGPSYVLWANLDFLYWWGKDGPLPVPLVVSGTGAFIGNTDFSYGDSPGGRLAVGLWLDEPHHLGMEAGGLLLTRNRVAAIASSDAAGNPLLSRPVFNVLTSSPAGFLVSDPGVFAGSLTISSRSRFWAGELNFVRNVVCDCDLDVDLLVGFRYLDLDENLNIDQITTVLSGPGIPFAGTDQLGGPGSILTLSDRFVTRNHFFLGQAGARTSLRQGRFSLDALAKVGIGPNLQQVRIDGQSQLGGPAIGVSAPGGLLALAGTNIGLTRTSWFSIVPEVGLQLGWNLTYNLKLQVGYSFLYMNSVVRPGDQINVRVNPSFVPASGVFGTTPTPAEPSPAFRKTDYYLHGINAGVTLRF
jgi:hypothetical protein